MAYSLYFLLQQMIIYTVMVKRRFDAQKIVTLALYTCKTVPMTPNAWKKMLS